MRVNGSAHIGCGPEKVAVFVISDQSLDHLLPVCTSGLNRKYAHR
jgi:hypothetical protein